MQFGYLKSFTLNYGNGIKITTSFDDFIGSKIVKERFPRSYVYQLDFNGIYC